MVLGFPLKEDSRKRDVEPKAVPGLFRPCPAYCDHTGTDSRRSTQGTEPNADGGAGKVELQSHGL
eukprot:6319444-Amphidinium_carterae.1